MIPPEALAWGIFIVIVIMFSLVNYYKADGRGSHGMDGDVAAVAGLRVAIAVDRRRGLVELNIPHEGESMTTEVQLYLTASQAQLLAQWLRIAAAPGRTLAEARRRMKVTA